MHRLLAWLTPILTLRLREGPEKYVYLIDGQRMRAHSAYPPRAPFMPDAKPQMNPKGLWWAFGIMAAVALLLWWVL